ncbi:phosphatidylethanolamine-binding protein [Dendryphion nanum]|uniref:Phosphatidylethanolamine-binding protein n=1 Tax=Dendryphion nanum TaxID=256645 RepID=A0A9P9IUP0_9PLEO|nr:phosphatidylethanolamine-binding protein [Dendryphion nanum]
MAAQIQPEALLASLSKAGLQPSLAIPETFKPSVDVSVSFEQKPVVAGNLFRVSEVKNAPEITFTPEVCPSIFPSGAPMALKLPWTCVLTDDVYGKAGATESTRYTLLLVDPDAPTPDDPKFAYWRHWVVSGLTPASKTSTGQTLTEYLAPGPKDESKPHRYLFLVFREPEEGLKAKKEDVGGEEFVQRRSFGVKEWVEKWGLSLVGVNWMLGAGDGWKE